LEDFQDFSLPFLTSLFDEVFLAATAS
jgi:hypothetical protein